MTGSEELTEEELVPLENKAYAYYDELIDHVLKTRAESGNTEDLTQEEYEKFQQMARVRLEYYKNQYLKERRAKESCLKHSQYILNIKPIEAPTNFTSRQYWDFIMPELTKLVDEDKPGEQFRLNEKTEFMLKMFCHYFACDERFYWYCRQNFDGQPIIIDGRPDLNKGLGCFGSNGVGKSLFLKAFRNNPRFSYIYKKQNASLKFTRKPVWLAFLNFSNTYREMKH
ncbi:hypothetical protein [Runella sp.]|uniref:hypothetical protein n=1 Tax=Runella sp. TaxID=1960881 RepID=UPI003D0F297F